MTRTPVLLALAGLLGGGPAFAQTPPPGHVDEIVVTGRRPVVVTAATCPDPDPARHPDQGQPRVVDSYPAAGDRVAPGYVQVRVSFDQPMSCYSEVMVDGGEGDPCQPDGTWVLPDRRSWLMTCRFAAVTPVRISFKRIDGRGFVALSGRAAAPYVLDFTTTDGPPTATLAEAAAAAPATPGEGHRATAVVTCVDRSRQAGSGRDCRRYNLAAAAPAQ